MRFKIGSKVEVMGKTEVPKSWRCAEIISGNGHTYNVKYDCYMGSTGDACVERVSRKAIRPCPPAAEVLKSWVAGDVVEVFDDFSWKMATVLKVLRGEHYLVRPIGFSQEFSTHRSNIRLRQSWEDDKWVVIGKGSGSFGNWKPLSTSNCYQKGSFQAPQANRKTELQARDGCFTAQKDAGLQESQIVSSRMPKRASICRSSVIEVYTGNDQKRRAIEKEGRQRRIVPARLLEKVDAVAFPRENLGEEYMHASLNNRLNGYYNMENRKLYDVFSCSLARNSGPSDSDSDACSVGSCGDTSNGPNKNPSHFVAIPCQDTDTLCSDAESFYGLGVEEENCTLPPEEEVVASIHRLELHAYRCTLEALYASGPLSWDQEALLTNLRITLHISNDEHLMELRNLISSGTGIHLC